MKSQGNDLYSILSGLGIRQLKKTPSGFAGCCHLNPSHNDSSPSMHIHATNGWVKCFGCGAYRTLFDFLIDNGVETSVALEIGLATIGNKDSYDHRENVKRDLKLGTALPLSMLERGFSKETLKNFGVGYDVEQEAITIPLVWAGELIGVQYRQYPKEFWVSEGFIKDHFIYNFEPTEERIYVEGFTDCWRLWQRGYTNVSALLQAVPSVGQKRLMRQHRRIILAEDNDQAGLRGMYSIYKDLHHSMDIEYVPYPGKDPDSCTDAEWEEAFGKKYPINALFTRMAMQKPALYGIVSQNS